MYSGYVVSNIMAIELTGPGLGTGTKPTHKVLL